MALSSLKTITLRELKLNVHHRGCAIILKTFCEPRRIASIMSAVEDENGDVDRVALYNFPINKPIDRILPKNKIVAIKEPYYTSTIDGGVLIRIDHPSDLIPLRADSSSIPSGLVPISTPSLSPAELKEKGNEAFKQCDWQAAVDYWSTALGLKQDEEELRHILHRNRSQARIYLGHYELAVQDAMAAIIQGDLLSDKEKLQNAKTLHRAGRAAYELRDFLAAKQHFTQALENSPEDKDVLGQLHRTNRRLTEQIDGEYDFAAMSGSATKDNTALDHASFLGNTKVASAGDHGRGLFATKNLAPGDIVLIEKAFHATFEKDLLKENYVILDVKEGQISIEKQAERVYGTIDKIIRNPKQASRYLDLYDGGKFQNKVLRFVDGMATIDTFLVQAIDKLNGFDFPSIKSSRDGSGEKSIAAGIWLHVSHANHSCIPNADRSFIGDMMVVRATRGIKAGEEICMSYLNPEHSYPERKKRLSEYGIDCDCPLCKVEKSMPAEVFSKRAKLVEEIESFLCADATGRVLAPSAAAVKKAEILMAQLEDTYPEEQYHRLPRLECVHLSYWMCSVRGPPEERLKRAIRGLRNFGVLVKMNANRTTIDRSAAVVGSGILVHPTIAASACLASGKTEAARQFQELRKEMYTILYACEVGLDDK